MNDEPLMERVRRHLLDAGFFRTGSRVLVAVSGGPDSVALLLLLHGLSEGLAIELHVGHVDHGILPESGRVAAMVSELAARLGIPAHTTALHLGSQATETSARLERYRALRRMQRDIGAPYLVTAHHADDQVETILFRLLRGSGVAGLSGMRPVARGGLVRPLLPWRKSELYEWLDGHGMITESGGVPRITHRDPSNEDHRHDRAWLRAVLLPELRDRFGEVVDDRVLASGRAAATNRAAWAAALRSVPELEFHVAPDFAQVARGPLLRYDDHLSEALLQALGREIGCQIGPRRAGRLLTQIARAKSGRSFDIGGGWVAELTFGHLRIHRSEPTRPVSNQRVRWDGAGGTLEWGDWTISWRRDTAARPIRGGWVTWVTEGSGEIRGPSAGDRLRPLGGVGRRRVSRLLMEGRIPRSERRLFPVVVRGSEILWLPGVCRAEAAVPRAGEPAIRLDARIVRDPVDVMGSGATRGGSGGSRGGSASHGVTRR